MVQVEGKTDEESVMESKDAVAQMAKEEKPLEWLEVFQHKVKTHWVDLKSRVLGHMAISPPIGLAVSKEGFTKDFAIVMMDPSSNFKGNGMDLNLKFTCHKLTTMMYPHCSNRFSFKYLANCLLKIQGTIPLSKLYNPTTLKQDGQPCIMVLTPWPNQTSLQIKLLRLGKLGVVS